ncbi:hypothetical protein MKX03_019089 [Papaver bracteatum]|nr:hypothetical protein MKX03_019089 [Papaver bracteatum]
MRISKLSSSSSSGTIDSQSLVPAIENLALSPPTETSASSSVIDKVISDIDLLTLILICLPVKSLLVFKSVSKQWFSIISDPIFAVSHSRRPDRKISGLFLERNAPTPMDYIYESFYHFLLLDGRNKCEQGYQGEEDEVTNTTLIGGCGGGYIKIPRIFANDPEPGKYGSVREFCVRVSQSCNGLLCCIRKTEFADARYFEAPCTYKTYIHNPTTRQHRCLPPSPFRDNAPKRDDCCIKVYSISLAFDPIKSMEYQVICIWRYQPNLSIHPDLG